MDQVNQEHAISNPSLNRFTASQGAYIMWGGSYMAAPHKISNACNLTSRLPRFPERQFDAGITK